MTGLPRLHDGWAAVTYVSSVGMPACSSDVGKANYNPLLHVPLFRSYRAPFPQLFHLFHTHAVFSLCTLWGEMQPEKYLGWMAARPISQSGCDVTRSVRRRLHSRIDDRYRSLLAALPAAIERQCVDSFAHSDRVAAYVFESEAIGGSLCRSVRCNGQW